MQSVADMTDGVDGSGGLCMSHNHRTYGIHRATYTVVLAFNTLHWESTPTERTVYAKQHIRQYYGLGKVCTALY